MKAGAQLYDRWIATPYEQIRSRLDDAGIEAPFSPPLVSVIDWLIGDQTMWPHFGHWEPTGESSLITQGVDAAPIIKLSGAIISQAIADRASRIDLYTGVPNVERQGPQESPEVSEMREEEHGRMIEASNPGKRATSKELARMLAKAGIGGKLDSAKQNPLDNLTVIYTVASVRFEVLRIPANLVARLVRCYRYKFNYGRCASVERPENLIYVTGDQSSGFAAMDHYDPKSDHKIGMTLEYES